MEKNNIGQNGSGRFGQPDQPSPAWWQKSLIPTWLGIVVIVVFSVVAFGGVFVYEYSYNQEQQPKQIACTQEAKICPDGSAVGRTGPNCEFVQCPSADPQTAGWQTYRNEQYGFEIRYPQGWSTDAFGIGLDIYCDYKGNSKSCEGLKVDDMDARIGVVFYKNMSLNDFIKLGEDRGSNIIKQEKYILNGFEGIKMIVTAADTGLNKIIIFISRNNAAYIIDYVNSAPIQEQILSTFRFIK